MSKWTEIRDGALEAMKEGIDDVTEETKQKFMENVIESGIPVVEGYATAFTDAVEKQSAGESGWCKIRDMLVIPAVVKVLVWVLKKLVNYVAKKAQAESA